MRTAEKYLSALPPAAVRGVQPVFIAWQDPPHAVSDPVDLRASHSFDTHRVDHLSDVDADPFGVVDVCSARGR